MPTETCTFGSLAPCTATVNRKSSTWQFVVKKKTLKGMAGVQSNTQVMALTLRKKRGQQKWEHVPTMRQVGHMCATCNSSNQNDMFFHGASVFPSGWDARNWLWNASRAEILGTLYLVQSRSHLGGVWGSTGSVVNSLGRWQQLWNDQAPFLDMGTCSASIRPKRFKLEPLGDGLFSFSIFETL